MEYHTGHNAMDQAWAQLTSGASIRKFKFRLLGGRPMVGLQTLDLAIGVRVPASQPKHTYRHLRMIVTSTIDLPHATSWFQ